MAEQDTLHRAADTINELLLAHISDDSREIDIYDAIAVRDDIREMAYDDSDESVEHSFKQGEYALDEFEPTPSPEKNTVLITGLTGQRADEYATDEGKLVADYDTNRFYDDDEPVVMGVYPNMAGEREFAFPEARLRPV